MLRLIFIALALTQGLFAAPALAKVMLFGGSNHDQYLGCLECSEYASDSICNGYGRYGNEFGTSGIFNEFAGFGNEFSAKSPWNEYSTSKEVPVLVDDNGNFLGYFTINDTRRDAVSFAGDLKRIYDHHDGDLERVRISLCEAFGYSG